ncbi:hypothetical protein cypCar_00017651 [Cyprinus carpio]|nr:hypothetical protein cypCar_00017651 [Cyprinus carpio]
MMTSLFRRSNTNSNHGSGTRGGDAASGELNNRRPPRQVRRLEFSQAMDDFMTMFPSMEHEVIECVLRANHGAVDSTIDQLLQMSLDSQATDDSSDSEDSIPPERSQSNLSQPSSSSSSSLSSLTQLSSSSSALSGGVWSSEQDRKLKQYLEDERIALFLQNQEFMKELQRNRDFLIALEIGDNCGSASEEACSSVSDDALFLEKLKHMGKSTRKKLFEIARSFSEKTRRKKSKKRAEDDSQFKRLSGREEGEESKEVM